MQNYGLLDRVSPLPIQQLLQNIRLLPPPVLAADISRISKPLKRLASEPRVFDDFHQQECFIVESLFDGNISDTGDEMVSSTSIHLLFPFFPMVESSKSFTFLNDVGRKRKKCLPTFVNWNIECFFSFCLSNWICCCKLFAYGTLVLSHSSRQ